MASWKTQELTDAQNGLAPAKNLGPVTRAYFSITVPTATIAAADTLMLGILPAGKRLVGGMFKNTAATGAVTANIGNYLVSTGAVVTAAKFGTLTSLAAATSQSFGDTDAKALGYIPTVDEYVGIVTAAAAMAAGTVVCGWIEYM